MVRIVLRVKNVLDYRRTHNIINLLISRAYYKYITLAMFNVLKCFLIQTTFVFLLRYASQNIVIQFKKKRNGNSE